MKPKSAQSGSGKAAQRQKGLFKGPGWRLFGACGLYLLLALAYTYPIIEQLGEATPALGLNYTLLANSEFILEELEHFSSPATVERVFYPAGYTIHEGLAPSFMALLLGAKAEPALALNLSLLASLILASLGAYLLAFELTGSWAGSLLGGVYFGFCWQHFAHFATYPIFHLEWLPWFFWTLLRARRGSRKRWLPLTGLFFALASLSSWYFAVFLLLGSAVFAACQLIGDRQSWRFLIQLGLTLALTCILLLPFSPFWLLGSSGTATGGLAYAVNGSADLLSFLLPPQWHWWMGPQSEEMSQGWLGNPSLRANFLGWASLLLSLIGIPAAIKCRRRMGLFLVATAVLFSLLALGPFLIVNGLQGWRVGQPVDSIPNLKLPYYWLFSYFPFSATRATARYSIMTVLACSALLAFGIRSVLARLSSKSLARAVALGLLAAVLFDLWIDLPAPRKLVAASEFHQRLAQEDEGAVLQLPFQINGYRYPYYAAQHGLNVVGGAVDKPFQRFRSLLWRYPYYRQLLLLGTPIESMERFRDVFSDPIEKWIPGALSVLNVRYAVLHKNDEHILSFGDFYQPAPIVPGTLDWITPWFEQIYEDDLIVAFRRSEAPHQWVCPVLGLQWGEAEQHTGYVNRPLLGQQGDVEIYSSHAGKLDISFQLTNVYCAERQAILHWNGKVRQAFPLRTRVEKSAWQTVELEGLELQPGRNLLRISSPEPALSGLQVYGKGDSRRISFLLRRLSMKPSFEQDEKGN